MPNATGVKIVNDTEPTEPWKPALILKHDDVPGFRLKWVREDQVDRFRAEGWITHESDHSKSTPSTIVDGSPIDSTVHKRELVLMKIPEARAKARDTYYKSLTDGSLDASINEFKNVANEGTGKSYGEVKVVRGGA